MTAIQPTLSVRRTGSREKRPVAASAAAIIRG
jgi:hypothetical protein